jgi:hypothetical protein
MNIAAAATLLVLFLPFLLSLAGRATMPKDALPGGEHARAAAQRQTLWRRDALAVRHDHRRGGRVRAASPLRCRLALLFEHDLRANAFRVCREGKPVPTFPDHALDKKRGGMAPAALQPFDARWSRAESAPMPSPKTVLSGRSQRGDSAW